MPGGHRVPDATPLAQHTYALCDILHLHYPISQSAVAGFTYLWNNDGSVTPEAWLHAARQKWINLTGDTPEDQTPAMIMIKDKLLNNVPVIVKDQLTDNPLAAGAPWTQWLQCLVALLQKHWEKTQHQKSAREATELTLMNMQVEQAKRESKKPSGADKPVTQAPMMAAWQDAMRRPQPFRNREPQIRGRGSGWRGGPHPSNVRLRSR